MPKISDYDRKAAVEYAHEWAYFRNPAFYNYQLLGGDCTNFASQCIYAGSKVMNYTPVFGWYYRARPMTRHPHGRECGSFIIFLHPTRGLAHSARKSISSQQSRETQSSWQSARTITTTPLLLSRLRVNPPLIQSLWQPTQTTATAAPFPHTRASEKCALFILKASANKSSKAAIVKKDDCCFFIGSKCTSSVCIGLFLFSDKPPS